MQIYNAFMTVTHNLLICW